MKEILFNEVDYQLLQKLDDYKKLVYVYKKLFSEGDVYFDESIWSNSCDFFKSILLMMFDGEGVLSSLKLIYYDDLEKRKIITNLTLNGFLLKNISDDGKESIYKILSTNELDRLGYN